MFLFKIFGVNLEETGKINQIKVRKIYIQIWDFKLDINCERKTKKNLRKKLLFEV